MAADPPKAGNIIAEGVNAGQDVGVKRTASPVFGNTTLRWVPYDDTGGLEGSNLITARIIFEGQKGTGGEDFIVSHM